MQYIEIKKLGPVRYFRTNITQYVFLIGEQASGKSTIAKSIYFCRNYKTVLRDALYDVYNTGMFNGMEVKRVNQFMQLIRSKIKSLFIECFGYSWDFDPGMYLKYEFSYGEIWFEISIESRKHYINLMNSRKLSGKLNVLISEVINLYRNKYIIRDALVLNSKERIRVQNMIRDKINDIFKDYSETYYIPAGRSILSLLSRADMSSIRSSLDYITCQFLDMINTIRRYFSEGIDKTVENIAAESGKKYAMMSKSVQEILKANYHSFLDKEFISVRQDNSEYFDIPLNFASSGQQECLWLLNLLYILLLRKERCFVIIEEPEAHLYPVRQYKLMKFITYFANETGSNILITTHSPYCLTSLNTLYVAGSSILMSSPELRRDTEKIIGGNYSVAEGSLSAYKVQFNGIKSLISNEYGELDTEMIDEVSTEILGEYAALYELISKALKLS